MHMGKTISKETLASFAKLEHAKKRKKERETH